MATSARHSYRYGPGVFGWLVLFCVVAPGCGKKSADGAIDASQSQRDTPSANPQVDAPAPPWTDRGQLDGSQLADTGPVVNTCSKPADCVGEDVCPADALAGCTCVTLPKGKGCLPRCSATSDCPKSSETVLACSAAGLCIPSNHITLDGGPRAVPDARHSSDAALSDTSRTADADALAPDTQ